MKDELKVALGSEVEFRNTVGHMAECICSSPSFKKVLDFVGPILVCCMMTSYDMEKLALYRLRIFK